jgi:alkylhydroperoxidase/carboxymuconolactone decarboxylase family protein YurZ
MNQPPMPEAWIDLPAAESIESANLSGKERPYDFGYVGAMFKLLNAHGRISQSFRPLFMEVMFAPGHLSRQEREMVAAVASAAQDCHY